MEEHANIMKFKGFCDDEGVALIIEKLPTNLRSLYEAYPLDEIEIIEIALGSATGLYVLHLMDMAHRDVTSTNILVSYEDGHLIPKLCDFGISKILDAANTPFPGCPAYVAPETLSQIYSPTVDIYSWGVVLLEMCTRTFPDLDSRKSHLEMVSNTYFRGLIEKCLKQEPEKRPRSSQLVTMLEIRQRDCKSTKRLATHFFLPTKVVVAPPENWQNQHPYNKSCILM